MEAACEAYELGDFEAQQAKNGAVAGGVGGLLATAGYVNACAAGGTWASGIVAAGGGSVLGGLGVCFLGPFAVAVGGGYLAFKLSE